MKKLFTTIFLLTLVTTACNNQAVARLNNEGNEAFENGDLVAAIEAYRNAQVEGPDVPEPYYNAGNVYYRQEDYENALLQAYQALRSADEPVAQSTFYNIGNVQFNTQDYEAAIESYKEALRINPNDIDAKHNLELALRQLQQQQQQQDQQQQQQDQQQQQQDQQQQDQQQQDQQQQQQQQQQNQQQQQQQQQNQDQQQQPQQPQDPQQQQQQEDQQQPQPQPSEEMTREQAENLLDAVADESQTLQEYLQRIFVSPDPLPAQDW
jgi:Ca-activated chloride channel family protein